MGDLTEKREGILTDKGKGARGRQVEEQSWAEMDLIGFPCLNFRIARIRQESSEGSTISVGRSLASIRLGRKRPSFRYRI